MLSNNIKSNNSIHVKAIIIDERNYMGNQNVKPQFSYSYEFTVNGEKYTGNSHDTTLKVGDTIAVEYDKNQPSISRPINAKN
jgi:hypothetical protein